MERPNDFEGNGDAKPKRPGGRGRAAETPYLLKILLPESLAAAVIGKGGSVIKSIRDATGAKLRVTEHSEFFPGTDCRICTAQAADESALNAVSAQIVAKLAECAEAAPSEPLGFGPAELRLRVLVPRAAAGGLIGKGGASIKQLREQSGAKVSIGDTDAPGPAADRVVTITGSQTEIEFVMAEVNKQIQLLHAEPWFAQWGQPSAWAPGAPTGTAGGRGGDGAQSRSGYGASGGDWHSSRGNGELSGLDLMVSVAQNLPEYVMYDQRGFALSCIVPSRLVGGLIGRGGSGTKEIQNSTGTKIAIREIPGDSDNKTLNISGPLSNTCAAYMLMMKRYLDAEAQLTVQ